MSTDLRQKAKAMGAGGYLGVISIIEHHDGEGIEESLRDLCAEAMATALEWCADYASNVSNPESVFRAEAARLRKP